MYLIRGIQNIDLFISKYKEVDLIATIGNFDGLHLGHQHIIQNMQKDAEDNNWKKLVIFTEPHAKEFFAESLGTKEEKPPRIFPWSEKVKKLKQLDVEFSFFLNFNNQLRNMTPETIIKEVLSRLSIKKIIIGDDFRFGANREGDFNFLKNWGNENNIIIEKTQTFFMHNQRVSSTRIRECLTKGDFVTAKELLGRPYTFTGKVVYGQQLGTQLGVPTANLWLPQNKLPIAGVYIVKVEAEGETYGGIANMGTRPTVDGQNPVLEVHILGFSGNLYGKKIKVEFLKKVRDEKKFNGLDELKEQIFKDISTAKTYFS
ncbi:MAG: bifunctional riboflavin kinase/FAD synthetase [SAR86 cluster bacterium]|nr:bifunctional riboflavin kinase/FAD synthetase [SAR86 cluster bacterium]